MDRRGFLRLGGATVALAAVLAACGGDDDPTVAAGGEAEEPTQSAQDVTILRTASSLEAVAVAVYQQVTDRGLVTSAAGAAAVKLFLEQHGKHGDLFEGATREAGGEPFETANPVVLQQLQPSLAGLRDEAGALRLAFDVENAIAATCFATVGTVEHEDLNRLVMSVGGIAARRAAYLAGFLGESRVPRVFQTADAAVAAGTGV